MPAVMEFDLYDERWRDCWVAATSAARLRKKQIDLDIQQRMARLLEEHGPLSDRPLTLRIYGTMIKGFCVINNERARVLVSECERVVLMFARHPFAEGDSKLRLPAAKRPKMEAALTLDLDLSRVEASEAFDWTQAPLEEGTLLRLGGGELGQALQPPLPDNGAVSDMAHAIGTGPLGADAGWLPRHPGEEEEMRAAAGARAAQADGQGPPPDPLMTQLVPTQEAVPPPALREEEPQPVAKRHRREIFARPGIVYGFDDEPMLPAKEYERWQQGCGECTLARKRTPIYAEEMSAQDLHQADHLAPHLRALFEPSRAAAAWRLQAGAAGALDQGPDFPAPQQPWEAAPPPPQDVHPADASEGALQILLGQDGLPPDMMDGDGGPGLAASPAEAQDNTTAQVGEILRGCLKASGAGAGHFHEVVPPGTANATTAACTFSALLALASAGELRVAQAAPFGPIWISDQPVPCH